MCLAIIALSVLPDIPVLVAANRDEYHARPTAPAAPWPDRPDIIAGRDLVAGGTWLGMTRGGRYALLTNYRAPAAANPAAPSRGTLVEAFLRGVQPPADYARDVHARSGQYNGFNLIIGDRDHSFYVGNRAQNPVALVPGVYSLSNHLLDTPWPKLVRVRSAVRDWLRAAVAGRDYEPLFAALRDRTPAPDEALPDTGIALERERLLSSPFIVDPAYGTRSSTVLALHRDGRGELHEIRYAPDGSAAGREDYLCRPQPGLSASSARQGETAWNT